MSPYNEHFPTDGREVISAALYHSAVGKQVLDYVSALSPAQLQAAMHDRAAETLAEIYDILEDPDLDDPHALQKSEAIVSAYFSHLGVRSQRHQEQD